MLRASVDISALGSMFFVINLLTLRYILHSVASTCLAIV